MQLNSTYFCYFKKYNILIVVILSIARSLFLIAKNLDSISVFPPHQEHRCFTSSCHKLANQLTTTWHWNLQLMCQRFRDSFSNSQSLNPLDLSPTLKATATSHLEWNFQNLTCWTKDSKPNTTGYLQSSFLSNGKNLHLLLV